MPELVSTGETRTEAVRRAILEELARRRYLIDAGDNLVSITFSVKLQDGRDQIRAVTYEDQTVRTKRRS